MDPKDAGAYASLARAQFFKNDFTEAAKQFLASNDLKQDSYTVLWRYLARSRAKQDAKEELAANALRLPNREWALPIIDFYLGRRSLEETRSAAVNDGQKCELSFYLAQSHILSDQEDAALEGLNEAISGCPKGFIEYDAAKIEKNRIVSIYLDKSKLAESENRLEDAVKALTRASSIDPDNKSILQQQIRVSDNLNQQKIAQLEAARKAAEEDAQQKLAQAEAARKVAEEAAQQKLAQAEAAKKVAEEEARQKLAQAAHSDDRDQSFQRIATSVTWVRDGAVGCCF